MKTPRKGLSVRHNPKRKVDRKKTGPGRKSDTEIYHFQQFNAWVPVGDNGTG